VAAMEFIDDRLTVSSLGSKESR